MKSFKKAWINLCGSADFLASRIAKPATWAIGGVIGLVGGAILGLGAAAIEKVDSDKLDDIRADFQVWKNGVVKFDTQVPAISPSSVCDIESGWYFAVKEKNGDYALYKGKEGTYYPLSADTAEDFAEEFDDCLDAMRALDEKRTGYDVDFAVMVSQPIRTNNTLANDPSVFRYLQENNEGFQGNLNALIAELGEDGAFNKIRADWKKALEAFEDGDVYDYSNDKSVQTYSYSYVEPDFSMQTVFNLMGIGLAAGAFGAGFTGSPSASYRRRAEQRDAKRRALDAKPLDF